MTVKLFALLLVLSLCSLVGCSPEADDNTVVNTSFTGTVVNIYRNDKQEEKEKYEGTWKDGKLEGTSTFWVYDKQKSNWQKKREVTWRDGKLDGTYSTWHDNGLKQLVLIYEDGELKKTTAFDNNGEAITNDADAASDADDD